MEPAERGRSVKAPGGRYGKSLPSSGAQPLGKHRRSRTVIAKMSAVRFPGGIQVVPRAHTP